MHLIKIVAFIEFACRNHCSNDEKEAIYWGVEFVNIPSLIINWSMAISMISKLSKLEDNYPFECLDEFKSRMIKIVVLYSLSYVFIICQYLIMKLLYYCDCCKDCCDRCNHNDRNIRNYSYPVRNVNNTTPRNITNNNNQNNIRSTTSRNNINTNRAEVEVRVTNTNERIILLFNILPREVYEN